MELELNQLLSMYCERTGSGVWDEPFNAVSNLAFIVAGLLAWRKYKNSSALNLSNSWDIALLIVLLLAIGIGSGLWHLSPNSWTVLADVIPILLFINVYLLSFLYRIARMHVWAMILLFGLFQLLNFTVSNAFPSDFLNGSIFYAPAWLTLIIMGIYLYTIKHELKRRFLAASGLFTTSLVFRSMDQWACGTVPIGTHFIWHVLNAWLLYLVTTILIQQGTTPRLAKT